jgi:protein subunit release factor A
MKSSLLYKLERLAERRAEIERELSTPDVIGNQEKFRRLPRRLRPSTRLCRRGSPCS